MKVERTKGFDPVTITLESELELAALYSWIRSHYYDQAKDIVAKLGRGANFVKAYDKAYDEMLYLQNDLKNFLDESKR